MDFWTHTHSWNNFGCQDRDFTPNNPPCQIFQGNFLPQFLWSVICKDLRELHHSEHGDRISWMLPNKAYVPPRCEGTSTCIQSLYNQHWNLSSLEIYLIVCNQKSLRSENINIFRLKFTHHNQYTSLPCFRYLLHPLMLHLLFSFYCFFLLQQHAGTYSSTIHSHSWLMLL